MVRKTVTSNHFLAVLLLVSLCAYFDTGDELLFEGNNKINEIQDENEMDYWFGRIDRLKREHNIINKIIETEYEKKIENTNKIYEPPRITQEKIQRIKPCFEWRAKIMKCYEENPRQPLRCSAIVQAFNQCVTSCRIED